MPPDTSGRPEASGPQRTKQRADGNEIWRRLEASPAIQSAASPARSAAREQATKVPQPQRGAWRRLGVVATIAWTYLLIKVFIGDVDRLLISAIAPSFLSLIDYRVVGYLAIMAFVALTYRRWWPYFLYVASFPVIVLAWMIPRYLIRHRSWSLFLGIVQGLSLVISDLPYNIFTKSLAAIAAIFIITTNERELLTISAAYVVWLYAWSILRRARQVLGTTPSFVDVQRRAIKRVMNSKTVSSIITLGDEYLASEIEFYDSSQATQVQMTIAYGIGLNKLLLLWAYRLEEYRNRKRPAIVFAALSYVWVFIAALSALTLLNEALIKIDPSQFAIDSPRSLIALTVYSLSTFFLGSAGGLQPVGDLAFILQMTGALTGLLVLAGGGVTVVATYLRDRDDTATEELVDELQEEADNQERRFTAAYALTPDQAFQKLKELRASAAGLIGFLVQAVPPPPSNRAERRHPKQQPNPYTEPSKKRRGRLPSCRVESPSVQAIAGVIEVARVRTRPARPRYGKSISLCSVRLITLPL